MSGQTRTSMTAPAFRGRTAGRMAAHGACGGSILVLALWTLFFLSALAFAVNTRVNGLIRFARDVRDDRLAYDAARAGTDQAMTTLASLPAEWDGFMNDEVRFRNVPVGDGRFSVTYQRPLADGSMVVGYGLIGEESKVNFNKAGRELLAALLRDTGGMDSTAAESLARQILAERGDTEPEQNNGTLGHDNDKPIIGIERTAGSFASLHELLLIPGMSREIFERVRPYATLYGTGKININSAPHPVLMALAESDQAGNAPARESLVRKLIRFRETGHAFEIFDKTVIRMALEQYIPLSVPERAVLRALLENATIQSSHFSGEAQGWTGDPDADSEQSRFVRRIVFVLDRKRMARADWHER